MDQLLALDGHFQRRQRWSKRKRGREGGREIIIGRKMYYPRGLLLIASLVSLRDMFVVDWMWIQLCRLRGVGISAQQTTAQFDIIFSSFYFIYPSFQTLPLGSPEGPLPSELALLWWIGILWVSNPLCGSLMSFAALASSIKKKKNQLKVSFYHIGLFQSSFTSQKKKEHTSFN